MRTFRLKRFILERPPEPAEETPARKAFKPFTVAAGPLRVIPGRDRSARRRISWDPSPGPGVVGYRIYWAWGEQVDYSSDFADVGNMTSLVLPTEVPSFPMVTGPVEIGVTALTESGNESDMVVLSAIFDFKRPEMPLNVRIKSIH